MGRSTIAACVCFLIMAALAGGCAQHPAPAVDAAPAPVADAAPPAVPDVRVDGWAYDQLAELCDTVGNRLAGSAQMRQAEAWALDAMRDAGFDSVWTEPVMVAGWERGAEWARCTAPVPFDMPILGLGLSEGTGPDGVAAEVLVVRDFDELERRAAEAAGRIVVFNCAWEGYGKTVRYRVNGASAAARHGAVAALIRSVSPHGLATPHTGMMRYADDAPRIPIAALTAEDAERLQRLADRGLAPRVHLYMEARNLGLVPCANVVGDIRGAERPDEIVLLGAHLDSWDVGTCAHDDGGGCVMVLGAARELIRDGRRPARTVRVVLYTAEEIGIYGGRAYRDAHQDELHRYVAALESDSGVFEPRGFSVRGDSLAVAWVAGLAAPLADLGADAVTAGGSGADIGPLSEHGVIGIGHRVRGDTYFHYHHSHADTFDKIDPDILAWNVAAIAGLMGAIADDPAPYRPNAEPAAVNAAP
jgi:carboxypeptidase Q